MKYPSMLGQLLLDKETGYIFYGDFLQQLKMRSYLQLNLLEKGMKQLLFDFKIAILEQAKQL